jgi:eukaryotic-like serine/threonine-protein kinase
MRATGGNIEPVYTIVPQRKEIATEWVHVLPGASGLLFRLRHAGQGPADFEIMAMALPHGQAHSLVRGIYATYAPSGHLLVVTADGKLVASPFDPKKLELTGAPVALIEGVGVRAAGFNIDLALAGNGTLAYTTGGTLGSRRAVWVSREGVVSPTDPAWDPQGVIASASLSADAKAIAVDLSRDGRRDICVKRLPDGPFSRITFGDTASVRPAWSPDGGDVLYVSDRSGGGVGWVYAHRADGTGAPRLVVSSTPKFDFGQVAPSRDGRWTIFRTAPGGAGSTDLLGIKSGDTTLLTLVASPAGEFYPALSPDGRWLAYSSNDSGQNEVYVRPFPETASAKWQVSTAGGTEPAWSSTGRELLYINGKAEMVSAEIPAGATLSVGRRTLFSVAQLSLSGPIPSYSLSPDDKRFLMVREGETAQQSELIVAENWVEQLKGSAAK